MNLTEMHDYRYLQTPMSLLVNICTVCVVNDLGATWHRSLELSPQSLTLYFYLDNCIDSKVTLKKKKKCNGLFTNCEL